MLNGLYKFTNQIFVVLIILFISAEKLVEISSKGNWQLVSAIFIGVLLLLLVLSIAIDLFKKNYKADNFKVKYKKINDEYNIDLVRWSKDVHLVLTIAFGVLLIAFTIFQFIWKESGLHYFSEDGGFIITVAAIVFVFVLSVNLYCRYINIFINTYRPMNKYRSNLISSLNNGEYIEENLVVLITNLQKLSTFSKKIKLDEKEEIYSYILDLDELKHQSFYQQYLKKSRKSIVILDINDNDLDYETVNKQIEKVYSIPHIEIELYIINAKSNKELVEWSFDHFGLNGKDLDITMLDPKKNLSNFVQENEEYAMDIGSIQDELDFSLNAKYHKLNLMPQDIYLLIKKVINVDSGVKGSFLMFDIFDLTYKLLCYKLLDDKSDLDKDDKLFYLDRTLSNYSLMHEFISESNENLVLDVDNRFPIDNIKEELDYICEHLHVSIEYSDSFNFDDIALLLVLIRNKTKGHGVITEELGLSILNMFFKMYLLFVSNINVELLNKIYKVENIHEYSPYILNEDKLNGMWYLQEVIKHKKDQHKTKLLYVNFIEGQMIKPSYKQVMIDREFEIV